MTSDGLLICRPSLEATFKVLFNHSLDRAQCVYVAEKSANVDTGTVVELRGDDVVVMTKDLKSVKVVHSPYSRLKLVWLVAQTRVNTSCDYGSVSACFGSSLMLY